MPDEILVLQVRDATLTRRDIGVQTAALDWAIRNKAPDTDAELANILAALGLTATEATLATLAAAIDVNLSTRASEATLASILAQLDIPLSSLGTEATLLAVATEATLASVLAALDVNLSTRSSEATLVQTRDRIPEEVGTWDYEGGVSGTVNVPAGARVLGIAAIATAAGATLTINAGDAVPIPDGIGIDVAPRGNLVAPVLDFVGTASFFVEWVA